jgi:hypothetical protein
MQGDRKGRPYQSPPKSRRRNLFISAKPKKFDQKAGQIFVRRRRGDAGKHESQNQCQRQNKNIDISIDILPTNNYFIDGDTQVVAQVSARAYHHLFLFSLSKILIFNALDGLG